MNIARSHRLGAGSWIVWIVALLSACGGGGDSAPPAGAATSAVIGAAGGALDGPDGSRVVVPPAALAASATIGIARSSDGAPALPAGVAAIGSMFALTPHGTAFAALATVTLPLAASSVPTGASVGVVKTDAAGTWQWLSGAVVAADHVSIAVTGFSWINIALLPPAILTQPADISVVAPASATFGVVASTDATLWQWERSNDGGVSWTAITGATAATYATAATSSNAATAGGDDGALFRARITGPGGISQTRAARLTVTVGAIGPAITTQPQDLTVAAGDGALFSVVASGTTLVYQWQRSNDGGVTFVDIGVSASSYLVTPTAAGDDNARFRVIVSNAVGSVTSSTATLTVTSTPTSFTGSRLAVRSVALAALATGSARSWGQGGFLGDPSAIGDRTTPGPVPGLVGVVSVAAGSLHSLALTASGDVWGWGYDGFGALGDGMGGAGVTISIPKRITTIANVAAIAAGNSHSVFLKTDGTVWTAGANGMGQLGNGTFADSTVVTQVQIASVAAISTYADHTLALKRDGTVWAWGLNLACQLGDVSGATPCVNQRVPVQVLGLSNVLWIAAGGSHSLALVRASPTDTFGSVWGWGSNSRGQLGIGVATPSVKTAIPVWNTPAARVSAGESHSLVMHFDGTVFSFGDNLVKQLGDPSFTGAFSDVPRFVSAVSNAVDICASTTNLVQVRDGSVFAWSLNPNGQVGNGTTGPVPVAAPTRVTGLNLN